jgi:hypothetical protein
VTRGLLAPGRWLRGVAGWSAAAVAAGVLGATTTVAYLMAREAIVSPPFAASDWWLFVNMWRPLVIAGAVLVPLFSAVPAIVAVALIRRYRWPRPAADILAGAASGLVALGLVILAARVLVTIGDA